MMYGGLLFSERDGVEISFVFTEGELIVGVRNEFDDDVEEPISEADARTLLAYLKEKLGE